MPTRTPPSAAASPLDRVAQRLVPRAPRRGTDLAVAGLLLALALAALLAVDLEPRVESDFFFASDDPSLAESREIERLFPARPQIFLTVSGPEPLSEEGVAAVERLTEALAAAPSVERVVSLTEGPATPADVARSELWRRLLLSPDGEATQLLATPAEGSERAAVEAAEAAAAEVAAGEPARTTAEAPAEAGSRSPGGSAAGAGEDPGAQDTARARPTIELSGVPYVVEQIRRRLGRDLRVFSLAALVVFGLALFVLFRSKAVVAGSLATCVASAAVTLGGSRLAGIAVGPLTANLATVVFVLALSHVVFVTARWRREGGPPGEAARRTFPASFWSAVTTLAGFTSLLLAPARPLAELGLAGVLGTAVAFVYAYGLYPALLRLLRRGRAEEAGDRAEAPGPAPARRRRGGGLLPAALLALLVVVAAPGIERVDTDPGLLSYFDPDSPLGRGLAAFDASGGSSPLLVVVEDPEGERLDTEAGVERMRDLQRRLEEDPAVGTALSPAVLLAEAARNPLTRLLTWDRLLDLLATERFDRVAESFVTEDRLRGLYTLRMREAARTEPRREVVARVRRAAEEAGLRPALVGGIYALQGEISALVTRSLLTGLVGLWLLFVAIAAGVARPPRAAVAMAAVLAALPAVVLGAMGWLRLPLDVIATPAVNVALALGVDSMLHTAVAARRRLAAGASAGAAWAGARAELARPVWGAALVVAAGFGIFGLSSFPPTRRFGLVVVIGTLLAAASAVHVLPALARGVRRKAGE